MEQNSSNSIQCCHGHGQLPDRERAEVKTKNARQKYCGYGQLPDLVCSQLEQNSNSRQCCHGHGQLPDRECFAEKDWRVYSKATNLSESAKEKYVPETERQVAPSHGARTDYTQVQTCNPTNKCNITTKNRRSEPKMGSNKSVDGRQKPRLF